MVMLLGDKSREFRDKFIARQPTLADRIYASGALPGAELSRHLQACDVMIQPYPDGVTTRRTSAMMALAHGLPLVTNSGHLTEDIWREHRAVNMTPAGNPTQLGLNVSRLLNEHYEMKRLAAAGKALYEERFAMRHTIAALRDQSSDLVQV
jgi:glycosyltransferase involved in cell wall biosynthesis